MRPLKAMTKPSTVRVLGIDPGFDRLGLAVIEGSAARPIHIWSECVTSPKGNHETRIAAVYAAVRTAIETYTPTHAALETLFFSKNVKTALAVAEARGAILAALGGAKLPISEISPGGVKIAVTGYGNADKTAIMHMLPKLLTLPPKKRLDDEFDALSVAIAGLASIR